MATLDKKELLAQLEQLDHRGRLRHVSSLAHRRRDDPALETLLDALAAGDLYQRSLALRMALVAGRQEQALRALRCGSVLIEVQAGAVGRIADAEALADILPQVAPATRRRLLAQVARRRRTRTADQLLPQVLHQLGAREAARLLRACSPARVRRTLPEVAHAVADWRRLAALHPDPVLEYIRQRQTAGAPRGEELWVQVAAALPALAVQRPNTLIDLALALLAEGALPRSLVDHLGTLARRAPERTGEILLHPGFRRQLLRSGLPSGVIRHLRRLSPALIRELARLVVAEPAHLAPLLRALPATAPTSSIAGGPRTPSPRSPTRCAMPRQSGC